MHYRKKVKVSKPGKPDYNLIESLDVVYNILYSIFGIPKSGDTKYYYDTLDQLIESRCNVIRLRVWGTEYAILIRDNVTLTVNVSWSNIYKVIGEYNYTDLASFKSELFKIFVGNEIGMDNLQTCIFTEDHGNTYRLSKHPSILGYSLTAV